MKTQLRRLRENLLLNKVLRTFVKKLKFGSEKITLNLVKRWPPYGLIECSFNNIPFKLFSKGDDGHVHYLYYNTNYREASDLQLFIELSKRSKCIIDIGANTGLFSILASKANPESYIYAFEPYKINAERLKLNLKVNKIENVQVTEVALGEMPGEISMFVPEDERVTDVASMNQAFPINFYPEIKWKNEIVKVNTLDNFAKTLHEPIDLIKCDVESFEMSVFKGAKYVLEFHRPIIMFECFLDEERKQFFNKILHEYGYYVCLIQEAGLIYCQEGMLVSLNKPNYLLTPVKPSQTFVDYSELEKIYINA